MKKNKLKIVYYHTISDFDLEFFPKKSTQSVDTFRKQIKHLNRNYNIISIEEALHKYKNKESFNNNLVITTDDGFKENYTTIAPVLSEYNLTFTALLCNDLIDNKNLMWRNILYYIKKKANPERIIKLIPEICSDFQLNLPNNDEDIMSWSLRTWPYKLKDVIAKALWENLIDMDIKDFLIEKQPYLTSDQISELTSSGFSVGCHSRSHPYFKAMTSEEVRNETIEAANDLERKFSTKVNTFSFPFERPQDSVFLNQIQKDLDKRFDAVLGIHASGQNYKSNPNSWERISMEFEYHFSLLNFYISPLKKRITK